MATFSEPQWPYETLDSVDKEQIAENINFDNKEMMADFAATSQVPGDENLSFGIKFMMGTIQTPISLQDTIRLKQISEEAPHGKGCNVSIDPSVRRAFQIDSEKVLSISPKNFDLWLVARHLKHHINLEDVEVKLDKLVLYETGGHFKQTFISSRIGTIGTVILQLPVEGGHEGGRFVVEYKGRNTIIETYQNSAQSFYLSSFYNVCHHFMEPVTKGHKLTLVFNLIWKNLKSEIPHDFPVFNTALNGIRKVLNSWIPCTSRKELVGDVAGSWKNLDEIDDSPEVNSSSYNEPLCLEKTLKEKLLYIPLQEKYDENYLTFKSLRGKDHKLAQLIENCRFLDRHLAIILRNKTKFTKFDNLSPSSEVDSQESYSNRILRWINADNVNQKLNIELDWDRQCAGPSPFRNHQLSDAQDTFCREDEFNSKNETQFSYHFVLVIWPKHLSIQIYCRYGLSSLLDQLEDDSRSATVKSQTKARQRCIQVLRHVISFCCTNPQMVWILPGMEKGELTLRLLRLCTTLQTCKEGLILLKILGSDFRESSDGNDTENFEGIQNEQVAQAIAEFECLIGWDDIAELIKRLVTPRRISRQMIPIIKLAKYLLDVNCVEGAKVVGDSISSLIANMDNTTVENMKHLEVEAFIDLVVSLETNAKSSSEERKKASINFFSRLDILMQCRLVTSLEAQDDSSLKSMNSCTLIFKDMCQILSAAFDFYNPLLDSVIVEVMSCYIRLGNPKWLESMIAAVSQGPVITSEAPDSGFRVIKKNVLERLISSPVIKESATYSELGNYAMILLLKDQFILLLEELPLSTRQVDEMSPTGAVLSELSSCLKLLIKLEHNSKQKSEIPFSLLENLEIQQLLDLLIDLLNDSQLSSNSEVSLVICKSLFSLMMAEKVPVMLHRQSILEAVKCLNRLADKSLIESLLKQVCAKEIIGPWDRHFKYELFDNLITSSDIWSALNSASKLIVVNSCTTLVTVWIMDDCRKLESSSVVTAEISKIFCCVKLLFLVEKNGFGIVTANAIIFEQLLSKLSISQLTNLVLDFYESEIKSQPSLKQFPTGFDWFRNLCRLVFSLDFVSIVNINRRVENIFACLLLLDDEQSWQHFASQMCKSCEEGKSIIEHIVRSAVIRQAVLDSSLGLAALTRILDYWITSSPKKQPLTWEQPNAVFENNTELQEFLRSSDPSICYGSFKYRSRAIEYGHMLIEKGLTGNFSVEVKTCFRGKSFRCVIQKIQRNEDTSVDREQTDFVKELVELRRNLSLWNEETVIAAASMTSGEMTNPSPSKRQRNTESHS